MIIYHLVISHRPLAKMILIDSLVTLFSRGAKQFQNELTFSLFHDLLVDDMCASK